MNRTSRPLQLREGARFTCFGDGLCCTDIHLLGPVSRVEKTRLAEPSALVSYRRLSVLRFDRDGACVFLADRDTAGPRGCSIHKSEVVLAEDRKPRTCHRYPFTLMQTEDGGRVSTDHRCPCRTMGGRPLLQIDSVLPNLVDTAGRLTSDGLAPKRFTVAGKRVGFARYKALESQWIAKGLAQPHTLLDWILQTKLATSSAHWLSFGLDFAAEASAALDEPDGPVGPGRNDQAKLWFGLALSDLFGGKTLGKRELERPWSDAFARATKRTPQCQDTDAMLVDFFLDTLWSLQWSVRGSVELFLGESAILLRVAQRVSVYLVKTYGVRSDAAMAEAIMMIETSSLSAGWEQFVMMQQVAPNN